MNGKSMGMLIMAVVCGLGAMYGTTKLISKGKDTAVVETQDVLVAVKDFKVEEMLKPEVVKVVRMPKSAVPPGAFTSPKDVEDRWVQIGILEGEPVIDRKLAARGSPPGLVARIPKGMRAFAIEVNEQSGVSGFILPDHRVDVVQIEPGTNGRSEADTVLQDVLVLASGQTFTRPDDRSIQSRTVTVAVTPEQVDTLVSARSRGSLTLALRGLNDHSRPVTKPKPVAAPAPTVVATIEPPPPPPPPPTPPEPEPSPLDISSVTLTVEPAADLDSLMRLHLRQPPSGIGVRINPDQFPPERVDSVTWQLDESPPIPMTAITVGLWTAETSGVAFEPGAHQLTATLHSGSQSYNVRRVVHVPSPVQVRGRPPARYVAIYRGGNQPDLVRTDRSHMEAATEQVQFKAEAEAALAATVAAATIKANAQAKAEAKQEARAARAEARAEARDEAREDAAARAVLEEKAQKRAEEKAAVKERAAAAAAASRRPLPKTGPAPSLSKPQPDNG